MVKALVVFYSLEGNTKFIAEIIAKELKADLLALKPQKEISSKGFMRFVWGGKQVLMKEKPHLLPLKKNASDYDLIIIGTPVWNFSFSPTIRSFFSQVKLKNKKIALFCSHSGSPKKTINNMKYELKDNKIVAEIEFCNVLENKIQNTKLAKKWIKTFV